MRYITLFGVVTILTLCTFGCGVDSDGISNVEDINLEQYADDDNKAYVYIQPTESEKYKLSVYKFMGKAEYAYYTVMKEYVDGKLRINIIKETAINDSQCSNILNQSIVLDKYPYEFEIVYKDASVAYEIIDIED